MKSAITADEAVSINRINDGMDAVNELLSTLQIPVDECITILVWMLAQVLYDEAAHLRDLPVAAATRMLSDTLQRIEQRERKGLVPVG